MKVWTVHVGSTRFELTSLLFFLFRLLGLFLFVWRPQLSNDCLRTGIRLLRLLQHWIEQALSFRVDRFLYDGVDAGGALVVEGCTDPQLISINLGQSGDRWCEHLSIIIMHWHWVISQVNCSETQPAQVLFVGIRILEMVPIHPEVFQVGEVL